MRRRRKCYVADFEWLVQNKRDFTIRKSRYSDVIKIDDVEKIQPTVYSDEKMNPKIFSLLKKIKAELEPNLPKIKEFMKGKKFTYNSINSNLGSFCSEQVSNVDINSAYLTVLNRDKLISNQLCNEVNDLPKEDRLKILGLLAYEPDCFKFVGGENVEIYSQPNEFKSAFFYAVNGVSEIMAEISQYLKFDFIFYWVDGIYFFHRDLTFDLVKEFIDDAGFKSHSEKLTNFIFDASSEKYIKINFTDSKEKEKEFFVPTEFYRRKQLYGFALKRYLREKTTESFINFLEYQERI